MKKLLIIPIALFTAGCVNDANINKKIDSTKMDMKLLTTYHTTRGNLHKLGNDYVFLDLNSNGNVTFYKIDKNYDLISSKVLEKLIITPKKLKVKNGKIYVLGYSQTANKPIFLILDKNGNIQKKFFIGKKFNTPTDFLIQNNDEIIVLNSYSKKTLTDIVIYKNQTPHIFASKYAEEATVLLPYKNGYILAGNVSPDTQDAFVSYIDKNFKIIWTREIDFGLEESIKNIKIKNNEIILNIISQNYTGMEEYHTIKLNENGKILNHSKQFEIKNYPLNFQG